MHLILDDRELLKLQKVLVSTIMHRHFEKAYLFDNFEEWAWEMSDEGIGDMTKADDWDPARARTDTDAFGLKVWYAYLKTRAAIRKSLRQANRYQRAVQAAQGAVACETSLPYLDPTTVELDLVLQEIDLKKAIESLPQDQRTLFVLVHFSYVPINEAAKIMNRSRGAADMLLHRARATLCEALENPFLFDPDADPIIPKPKRPRGRPSKDLGGAHSGLG